MVLPVSAGKGALSAFFMGPTMIQPVADDLVILISFT